MNMFKPTDKRISDLTEHSKLQTIVYFDQHRPSLDIENEGERKTRRSFLSSEIFSPKE